MLVPLGNALFHTRNALIPLSFLVLVLVFPPRPLGDPVGTALLALGLVLLSTGQGIRILTIGLDYIRRGGKNKRIYADDLVTTGIYAHSRNPMYLGNILIAWGYLAAYGNLAMLALGGVAYLVAYIAIMQAEEQYLASKFGGPYEEYRRAVPRWLPRFAGLGGTLSQFDFDWEKVIRKEYGTIFTTAIVTLAIVARKAVRAGTFEPLPFALGAAVVVLGYLAARLWKKRIRKHRIRREAAEAAARHEDPVTACRHAIDVVDHALVELLSERARLVAAIFAEKDRCGLPRYDAVRSQEIVARAVRRNPGPLSDDQLREVLDMVLGWYLRNIEAVDIEASEDAEPESTTPRDGALGSRPLTLEPAMITAIVSILQKGGEGGGL